MSTIDKMVFAMTLAPWPIVLYHGADREDVKMRGLERLAAMGFQKPKPYFSGTVGELELEVGLVANAVIHTYMFGRASLRRSEKVPRYNHCQKGTTLEVPGLRTVNDIAEELLDELAVDDENHRIVCRTERASELLRWVHRVLGVSYPNKWVCTYITHALTDIVALHGETPDEMWPGGNLEDDELLLQWLIEYPRAVQTVDRAREQFGCCDSFIKDIAVGLELMSKTIFDSVYHYLMALVKEE